jgi:hypothetical protein
MQTLKRTKAFLTRYRDGYHRFRQEHSKLSVWITVAVCLLVLWGVFTPSANPFRSDKLVISGEFPYDKGFEFVVDQSAQTTNPIVNFVYRGTTDAISRANGVLSLRADLLPRLLLVWVCGVEKLGVVVRCIFNGHLFT